MYPPPTQGFLEKENRLLPHRRAFFVVRIPLDLKGKNAF